MDPLEAVLHYHETTKHHPHRAARSLGYMDWATQPDPFRRFRGAPCVALLYPSAGATPSYDALYEPGAVPPRPVCLETVSEFFQYSLALSAWKESLGSRWALRINPSSGNLHPTEAYLMIGAVPGLGEAPGVYHYAPMDHVLERRSEIRADRWERLGGAFPPNTFLAGLSSVHWREAWKYGERAYRYCQHDVGHALAALCLSAALQGWRVRPLVGVSDEDVGALLGLGRESDFEQAEREHPDHIIAVTPSAESETRDPPPDLPTDVVSSIGEGRWYGRANRLSSNHVEWEWIDKIASACLKPRTCYAPSPPPNTGTPNPFRSGRPAVSARAIIQKRRSAVSMDGRTSITADQFYLMMDRVVPRFDRAPWAALGPPAHVHLGLFVHRVQGLAPGLYFLVRSPARLPELREAMRREFEWRRPMGCPDCVPLFYLQSGDIRALAGRVSCEQEIAADGAFSLGMIAEFEAPLRAGGACVYRRLFWETGVIGQVLYLEAEAAGIRGTGIGCFFDDLIHDVFGFKDRKFQSLYHFTVGGPVEDTRLTTLPPYPPEVTARTVGVDSRGGVIPGESAADIVRGE